LAIAFGAVAWSEPKQTFGAWGVDLSSRDLKVKPGDSFFNYANGSYLARTEIPADQESTGAGYDVYNLTQDELRTLIEASAANPSGATATQVGGLYKSFMDEATVEVLDAKPLSGSLAAIQATKTKAEFGTLMAKTHVSYGQSLFGLQVDADAKQPISTLWQASAGDRWPDRRSTSVAFLRAGLARQDA